MSVNKVILVHCHGHGFSFSAAEAEAPMEEKIKTWTT